MGIGVGGAMRAGLVSGKAASKWKKPAVLKGSKVGHYLGGNDPDHDGDQDFDGVGKDEGSVRNKGHVTTRDEMNHPAQQKDRAHSMPSKGGAVNAKYTPGRKQIDQFPQGQRKTFPKGAGYEGRGRSAKTGNTRMKGPIAKSGGPYGGGGKGTQ